MNVADSITHYLRDSGVRQVFELCGGMTTYLLDSLYHEPSIEVISMHHEQAAGFAAGAVGRITGVPGVCLATSGPGATNLLTAIGSCYFDSFPAIFITGQVNRDELKADRPIRQLGFQECDIVSMARPITKAGWQIGSPEELPERLEAAFRIAVAGRCGPVLLDIPMDIQRAEYSAPALHSQEVPIEREDSDCIGAVLEALSTAKRPIILAGGGLHCAGVINEFRALIKAIQVPVVYSLMALDALPFNNPMRVGMLGSYGNRWANIALGRSDLLIAMGSRLDIRQTGADVEAFRKGRTIFHIDIEKGEINNRVTGCEAIVADLKIFMPALCESARTKKMLARPDWIGEIQTLKQQMPDTKELRGLEGINPNSFIRELSGVSARAVAFVVDVGQNQMWAAQSLRPGDNQRILTSGGMGAMGFALPAAIGVTVNSHAPVVVIAGDGGFQLNVQELETVARNRLPLKMIVLNNQSLGMVRQFQQSYFGSRYQSTMWGYGTPDFANVAAGFGIPGQTVGEATKVEMALEWLWQDPGAPSLLEVLISPEANAYPKIAFGSPLTEMEP